MPSDVTAIESLIASSVHGLQAADYTVGASLRAGEVDEPVDAREAFVRTCIRLNADFYMYVTLSGGLVQIHGE